MLTSLVLVGSLVNGDARAQQTIPVSTDNFDIEVTRVKNNDPLKVRVTITGANGLFETRILDLSEKRGTIKVAQLSIHSQRMMQKDEDNYPVTEGGDFLFDYVLSFSDETDPYSQVRVILHTEHGPSAEEYSNPSRLKPGFISTLDIE